MKKIKSHAKLILGILGAVCVILIAGDLIVNIIYHKNQEKQGSVPGESGTNPPAHLAGLDLAYETTTEDPSEEPDPVSLSDPSLSGEPNTGGTASEPEGSSEAASSENGSEGTSTEETGEPESSEALTTEEETSEAETSEPEETEEPTEESTEEPTEASTEESTEEPTAAPDPREQVLNHYQNLGVVNDVNNYLNVRDNPSLDATVIGKVLKFGGVNILEATPDGWLKIAFPYADCGYGYVYGEFVSQGQDAIALAVANSLQMISVTAEVLNVREQPNTDCKILTQIITGEHYQVVNIENGWVEITLGTNDATGEDILAYVSEDFVELGYYLSEPIEYVPEVTINPVRTQLVEFALQYLGGQYVWGGETLGVGVDCSGFTQKVFAHFGYTLHRVSYDQATQGTPITAEQMQPGDLIFYSRPGLTIGHVGIYIGNGQVLHAYNAQRGIIISPYNYATPMKIVNIIGD